MPNPPTPPSDPPTRAARRSSLTREELVAAALSLIGPNRSVSSLSLREVARAAGIAPNGFYRHFSGVDELAVILIERAGASLRVVMAQARNRTSGNRNVVRTSVEAFFERLRSDDKLLHMLLREGMAGPEVFKRAVYREFESIEGEMAADLARLAAAAGVGLHEPRLAARAIVHLAFAVGSRAIDLPRERDAELMDELTAMLKMIVKGARAMHPQA